MLPPPSSSSDELQQLPSVPRLRPGANGLPAGAAAPQAHAVKPPLAPPAVARGRKRARSRRADTDADDDEDALLTPLGARMPRRTLQARKVVVEEEEDEGGEDGDEEGSGSVSPSPEKRGKFSRMEERAANESNSPSPSSVDRRELSEGKEISSGTSSKDDDAASREASLEMEDVVPGQQDILAQLEQENEDSDQFDSDDSEPEKETGKKPGRLTSRQRAMQGENVDLEYTELESLKAKKKLVSTEDWTRDEEMELKKQQKARLRQMIHEKRNKEKRAAMVDKVLRGVTSKRKKYTMATEARAAQVGSRLSQNEMREGCIRFVSNRSGISLSLPKEIDEPIYLQASVKAEYPRICKRDPRTGKRIFVEA